MQLPPASAAAPRLPSPGAAAASHSGSAAGFDAVMGGVLASGANVSGGKASGAKNQPASDGGGHGKPAVDGSGTVARPVESLLVESRTGKRRPSEQGDAKDAKGADDPANAAAAAGACAPSGLAIAGIASGSASAQGLAQGLAQGKKGVSPGTAPLESIAGAVVTGNVAAVAEGTSSGVPGLAMQPATLPGNAVAPLGPGGVAILEASTASSENPLTSTTSSASVPAPSAAVALPAGNPGRSTAEPSTVQPGAIHPGPIQPGPVQPGPAQPIAASAASPAPANPEAAASTTAALAGEASTAVVHLPGKSGTQQDPELPGQGVPAEAGVPAGIPAVLPPASPLPQVPSAATPGVATPAPQADPAKLLPQVSGPLFSLASGEPGKHVMTLRLSPEDLGPLTVRAHIDGAGVRIELFAPGEVGREAVRSILPELRRGLGESGFGTSLDLSEHNAPADSGASGSDARDRRPAESPAFPRGSDGEQVRLPRTAVVLPRSSTSSLDILV
ncbi:flagellar hook-length control protein FliK [Arthrobacter sp. FW306-04-A]|uniref:flagellar hook-length control protein FliK n=1 Tax=Arthrobacter sp. FW306-04-A TaxID=2879619 RepID=UPI0037BFFB66|nr:flagellar hook-length control protein FliK [Arthrobacter sp. FW306-04-A]